jgi:hypothetical protein
MSVMEQIQKAAEMRAALEASLAAHQKQCDEINGALNELRGPSPDRLDKITGLIRKYGPKVAMYLGGPAAGAALTSAMADDGAFSGIAGLFTRIFSAVGLG